MGRRRGDESEDLTNTTSNPLALHFSVSCVDLGSETTFKTFLKTKKNI